MPDYKPGDHVAIDPEWNRDPEMMPKPPRIAVVTIDGWDGNEVQVLDDNDIYTVPRQHLTLVASSVPMTPDEADDIFAAAVMAQPHFAVESWRAKMQTLAEKYDHARRTCARRPDAKRDV
jgi:hypothetical protein